MSIQVWDPFAEAVSLRDAMSALFPTRTTTGDLTMRSPTRIQVLVALAVALVFVGPAWGQQAKPAADDGKAGPVVRSFGSESGYRTEVTSETKGSLNEEDQRQVAVLTAQVFQHIDEAREALDNDDVASARREVEKARDAVQIIRAIQPRTKVCTRTVAPGGKLVYEDTREVQEDAVPLFEGMIHSQILRPSLTRNETPRPPAMRPSRECAWSSRSRSEQKPSRISESSRSALQKAFKALADNKIEAASVALALAQVRGVEFRYSEDRSPLAAARDAMWLARRALEENNAEQARFNLNIARQRLRIYRELAPKERQKDVDQMLKEADQLETQLGHETAQNPASQADRTRQGNNITRWWEQMNNWFKKHL